MPPALLSARDTTRGPQREDRGGHRVPSSSLGAHLPLLQDTAAREQTVVWKPPKKRKKEKNKNCKKLLKQSRRRGLKPQRCLCRTPLRLQPWARGTGKEKNLVPCSGVGGRSRSGAFGQPRVQLRARRLPCVPLGKSFNRGDSALHLRIAQIKAPPRLSAACIVCSDYRGRNCSCHFDGHCPAPPSPDRAGRCVGLGARGSWLGWGGPGWGSPPLWVSSKPRILGAATLGVSGPEVLCFLQPRLRADGDGCGSRWKEKLQTQMGKREKGKSHGAGRGAQKEPVCVRLPHVGAF